MYVVGDAQNGVSIFLHLPINMWRTEEDKERERETETDERERKREIETDRDINSHSFCLHCTTRSSREKKVRESAEKKAETFMECAYICMLPHCTHTHMCILARYLRAYQMNFRKYSTKKVVFGTRKSEKI